MASTFVLSKTLVFAFVLVIVRSSAGIGSVIPECKNDLLTVEEGSSLHLTCTGHYTWWYQIGRVKWHKIDQCSQSEQQACYSHKYNVTGSNFTVLTFTGNLKENIPGSVGCGYLDSPTTVDILAQCKIFVVYPASKVRNCGLQWNTQDRTVSGSCEVDKLKDFDSSVFQCQWRRLNMYTHRIQSITAPREMIKLGSTCSFSGYQIETSHSSSVICLYIDLGSGWMPAKFLFIGPSTTERGHPTAPVKTTGTTQKDDINGDDGGNEGPSAAVIGGGVGAGLLIIVIVVIDIVCFVKYWRGRKKRNPRTTDRRNDGLVQYQNDMYVNAPTSQPARAHSSFRSRTVLQNHNSASPLVLQGVSLVEETGNSAIALARSGPSNSQNVDTGLCAPTEEDEDYTALSTVATSSGTQPQTRAEYAVARKPKSKRNSDPQHNDYAVVNKTRSNPRQALRRPSDSKTGNTPSSSSQELYTQVKKKSKGSNPIATQQLPGEGRILSLTQNQLSSANEPAVEGRRASTTTSKAVKSKQTDADYVNVNKKVDKDGQMAEGKSSADVDDEYKTLNFHRKTRSPLSRERDTEYSHIGAMGHRQ